MADTDPSLRPRSRPVIRQSGEFRSGSQAGNQRFRRARAPQAEQVRLAPAAVQRRSLPPAVFFLYGFAGLISVGTLLLALPFSTTGGQATPVLDALFTATSAVSLTGLVVVDTGTHWNALGQLVILALIQVGGLGFMTSSTLLILLIRRRIRLRDRLLLTEALGSDRPGTALDLAARIAIFTLVVELAGAVILFGSFAAMFDLPQAAWWALFHSIAAFNNAGFDLTGNFQSLVPFRQDISVLLPIALLMLVGGISYTVVEDLLRTRRFVRLALDTKLVLVTSGVLLVVGTVALLFTEWNNPGTLGTVEGVPRLMDAFFQTVTRTGGYSSIPIGEMTDNGLFAQMALMFIGGAAGSTAGGIKLQSFGLLFFAIVSAVYGATEVEAFRRRVPLTYVLRALAVALLSLALVFVVTFALNATDNKGFVPTLFEAFSAVATVGLSTGITPELSEAGKVILVIAMFVGRLGPITLVLALAARERQREYRWPEEPIKIG